MNDHHPAPLVVVSGGQTGVDRAALDAALAHGVPAAGWCPRGRWAEDGPIPDRYPLRETPSEAPAERTSWNVRDSDGTLVLTCGPAGGGTALTVEEARRQGKPLLVVDLVEGGDSAAAADWAAANGVRRLNVAGPRASEAPGAYALARRFVAEVLEALAGG